MIINSIHTHTQYNLSSHLSLTVYLHCCSSVCVSSAGRCVKQGLPCFKVSEVLSSHRTAAWGLNCAEHLTHLIFYCYFGSSHFSCLHHGWNYQDRICSEQQCLLWLWPVSWKTKELLWSLYVSAQCRFGTLPLHNLTAPVECEYTTQYGGETQMQLQPGSIGQANQCVLQHWCFSNSKTSILSGRFCFTTAKCTRMLPLCLSESEWLGDFRSDLISHINFKWLNNDIKAQTSIHNTSLSLYQ